MRQSIQEWTKFFKDCLSQNLLTPRLNTLSQIIVTLKNWFWMVLEPAGIIFRKLSNIEDGAFCEYG